MWNERPRHAFLRTALRAGRIALAIKRKKLAPSRGVIFFLATILLTTGAASTKAQGPLSLSPDTLSFGTVSVGSSRAISIRLKNSGSSKIVFWRETLQGVEFNVIGFALPLTLEAGKELSLIVQFAPRNAGEAGGTIVFESDASGGNVYVPLRGTGVSLPAVTSPSENGPGGAGATESSAGDPASGSPALESTGTSAAIKVAGFGSSPATASTGTNFSSTQGTTSTVTFNGAATRPTSRTPSRLDVASTQSSIKLVQHGSTYNGTSNSSAVVVTLNGVASGDLLTCSLTYGNSGGTTLSVSDNVNGSWLVANTVHFNSVIGKTTAQFYLANSKAGTTTITGTPENAGEYGAMNCQEWSGVATSNPLDQGAQQDGTTANSSSGSVTTTSGGELILGDLENVRRPTAGSGFREINSTRKTWLSTEYQIQANSGSVAASWTFAAASWTAQVATFKAAGSGAGTAASANINASPTSAVFTNVPVGTSNTQTIQLKNAATSSAVISTLATQGTGFGTSGLTVPLKLASGGTSTFNVTFLPTSTGTVGGMLTLSVSGTASGVVIPLVGSAIAATRLLSASPTSVSFGNVAAGGFTTLNASLANTGNSSVTVQTITTRGTGFSATGVSSGTAIAPGQTAVLAIEFAPKTTGSATGTIAISSNATNASTITIPVTGTGVTPTPTNHAVQLSWVESASTGVVGYNIYRSTVSGGPYAKIVSSPVSGTSYSDQSVQGGLQYYYVVTSVTANGVESSPSNQATASIP